MSLHMSESLASNPCIGVCSVTQWGDVTCRGCGRSKDVLENGVWNTLTDVQKKLVVMESWERGYYPRQKLELICEEMGITMVKAKELIFKDNAKLA